MGGAPPAGVRRGEMVRGRADRVAVARGGDAESSSGDGEPGRRPGLGCPEPTEGLEQTGVEKALSPSASADLGEQSPSHRLAELGGRRSAGGGPVVGPRMGLGQTASCGSFGYAEPKPLPPWVRDWRADRDSTLFARRRRVRLCVCVYTHL